MNGFFESVKRGLEEAIAHSEGQNASRCPSGTLRCRQSKRRKRPLTRPADHLSRLPDVALQREGSEGEGD
jgi:hypothetical protein